MPLDTDLENKIFLPSALRATLNDVKKSHENKKNMTSFKVGHIQIIHFKKMPDSEKWLIGGTELIQTKDYFRGFSEEIMAWVTDLHRKRILTIDDKNKDNFERNIETWFSPLWETITPEMEKLFIENVMLVKKYLEDNELDIPPCIDRFNTSLAMSEQLTLALEKKVSDSIQPEQPAPALDVVGVPENKDPSSDDASPLTESRNSLISEPESKKIINTPRTSELGRSSEGSSLSYSDIHQEPKIPTTTNPIAIHGENNQVITDRPKNPPIHYYQMLKNFFGVTKPSSGNSENPSNKHQKP